MMLKNKDDFHTNSCFKILFFFLFLILLYFHVNIFFLGEKIISQKELHRSNKINSVILKDNLISHSH